MRAEFGGEEAGLQLRLALMGKTVAHAKRIFSQREVRIHKFSLIILQSMAETGGGRNPTFIGEIFYRGDTEEAGF